jgi:hypothetical protein
MNSYFFHQEETEEELEEWESETTESFLVGTETIQDTKVSSVHTKIVQ